jgi:hypothetical protein
MVANMECISKRDNFLEQGLLILMGLPNATSVNQEMDALYGAFKSATYARGEVILTERLRLKGLRNSARAIATEEGDDDMEEGEQQDAAGGHDRSPRPALVAMGFEDLATVVNGEQGDEIGMKPFAKNFTKEKILASWSKVGFVPLTRKCINSKKVRHELGQRQRDESLEEIKASLYEALVEDAGLHGLNAGIFDATIPVAKHVERELLKEEQVKKLLATKGSFSTTGALWNTIGTRIGNASVVLRAQTEQLALDAKKWNCNRSPEWKGVLSY